MDDGDDSEYALRPPAALRRDTITRQLQREILGEMAVERSQEEPLNASREHEQKSEEDEPPSTPSKRRTLSPGKTIELLEDTEALDAAIPRRDTVSPEALKAVIRAHGGLEKVSAQKKSSPVKTRDSLGASELQQAEKELLGGSFARRRSSEEVLDSPARSTRSKTTSASKRPRSATKKTSPVKTVEDRRKSTSVVNTSDSFTDSMFAPNLLEQDAERKPTLDPTEAALVVAALRKEETSLSSSALEMDIDSDDEEQPSKQAKSKKPSTPSKENKQSPAKSRKASTLSRLESGKSSSPAKEATTRKSPSPAKETKKSSTPTKSSSKRRTTVDPSDVLTTLENNPQQQDDRRQTIDDNEVLALKNGLGALSADGKNSAENRGEEVSRKRANDSDDHEGSPEKRSRVSSDHNDATMESMDVDSPIHAEIESSPSTKKHKMTGSRNQTSPDELPPSRIPKLSLFSPPPRLRTPLKGILSARKERRNAETTPTKSVNFGPSQGAEFNHGSPSTSMTPMPARDASRLFPLERVSSEEEPDDAETSLNSSILDEADSLNEGEPKQVSVPKVTQLKKPGFDLLQSRRSSLMAPKSTDTSQRRHSMRGFSPLDSRAEIRRRRRQTINVTRQASKTTTSTSFSAEEPTTSSQSPSTARNNSFLRPTDVVQPTRMPYADSSASSDAGEDMEITGDYSIILGEAAGKQSQSFTGLPRDEDTAEFSLGHLLAESSVYELTKSAPESDLHDLPGSLGDLANEVADAPFSQSSHTQQSNDQDTTMLDPIQEANETMTSSRNHSTMSLVSDDSDEEYAAKRASLQVNLKAQFDRVSEPSQSPRRPPTPESLAVQLITMEELLSSVVLNDESAFEEAGGAFFGEEDESSDNQVSKDVKLACAHDTCSAVIERHAQDVSSWSSAVTEELSSLLHVEAPAVFSPENLDDAGREAIQELYATEALVARTGWCQLQTQMEKQLTSSLSMGADALANDVKSLKDSVAADALKRQNELAAIKEMIDREEQMGLLLDAIEEQQGAHDEYVKAVKELEKECSSLSLEESVLQSRLKVLEGRAAELEPVTSEAATLFGQEVLATEEMLAIQESMSVWKIREATASILRLSARFEDVLFDVEICVDVHLGSPSTGGASTSIKTNESLKRGEGNTYLPYEGDVVLVLQRLLLDPHYISRIADESELGDGIDGRICSKVQVLENFISRSFRLLKELRELSTHFSMRYDEDDSTLWVDFLKFPSTASRIDVEGAQFSVGFSLLPVFPYTDYQTAVKVPHGQVSTDAVAKEIELVSRQEPKYFTRVCRRLHESFVQ
ncbi:hypothetical protein JG687_00008196 [Phytophthora cactorum]|uniref:Uncharacterized protein n=1 Tax=Phytophthora cactorum TaxID=29920 RepID=A0A329SFU1_9STRA|nr:hypothetical protein Pcac1_g2681 [Phytophthora cactorum]KAG2837674.1 hypothetical protein PC112_g4840 [Phytophthora cactorum]KAG2840011.1 hypothetical protein PC111_g3645 [Phytophthora cactorum]KAG2864390.1 hypothetical protein PC113_g4600 [Phytophthora cactorum]KAG2923078.1 hypothetical protein PC114_g4945 [Phytophthora cactorum]